MLPTLKALVCGKTERSKILGEATLILGGTMVGPKTMKPHEIRGTSIEGGTTQQLFAGDIVHIPVTVPHQLKIASGNIYLSGCKSRFQIARCG